MQQRDINQPPELVATHELREITEILVKHHGLHEGLYDLALEFQISVGAVGPDPASLVPGATFGIKAIGIMKTGKEGLSTVDAAKVNPSSPANKVASKKSK